MSKELLQDISYQLEAFIEGGFWPNAHLLLEEINKELAKPASEPEAEPAPPIEQEAPLLEEVMGEIGAAKCRADLSKSAAKASEKGAPQ